MVINKVKKISLTQGKFAFVDAEDFEWLNQWNWHISSAGYALNAKERICMSRIILGLEKDDKRQADHINHNRCDNRRCNLRICTHLQNLMNASPSKNGASKYKGVSWKKDKSKWRATIVVNKKQIHLGYFKLEQLAALAYDFAAVKYFREFSCTNF